MVNDDFLQFSLSKGVIGVRGDIILLGPILISLGIALGSHDSVLSLLLVAPVVEAGIELPVVAPVVELPIVAPVVEAGIELPVVAPVVEAGDDDTPGPPTGPPTGHLQDHLQE